MAKITQELKADTVLKNYWNDNDRFADLFNAVLFEGKQVIKPDELEEMDTEESTILENRDFAESIQASRDNIKVQKKSSVYGVQFVLLGLESQESIHYAMPMRVMGYDYASYKKQYDSNAKKYKNAKGLEPDEFLSKMKKTDKFIPVITVVVYYGEKAWDGARTLHGMLDIPAEMKKYVNDYKMLLVEAREDNLKLHNINNIDLFKLLGMLLDKGNTLKEAKNKVIEYAKEHKVDKNVIMTVAGAANCRIDYNALSRKGDADMCTVFEETRMEGQRAGLAEGRREGLAEGRREGLAEGRRAGLAEGIIGIGFELGMPENDILEQLQKKLDVPIQTAMEYLERFSPS